jgi:16S rRNA (cytidine1402-2'-O)-methyltransferase
MNSKQGILYIVGTSIGNMEDISLRAVSVLKSVDLIACEELREGERLCRWLQVKKELLLINEHTESEDSQSVIQLLRQGASVALVSDCGMPVFADPGTVLIQHAYSAGIPVEVVPGATSLTAALAVSGFDVRRFYFYGFLSAKAPLRQKELQGLKEFASPIVFLDTPYRLLQVLQDLLAAFGPSRRACVACDLTMKSERVQRSTLHNLVQYFSEHKEKREYVLIVEGKPSGKKHRR